ncbi:C1 family peptidase [Dolichospermum sp. UHCC 0259]|uniref:C1 family peptidase n=1 Tax=Dolichospermum sp. UHCC 0259 TaxID=2590010 RepID=UPI0020C454D6|nr:C1 family peptidase [Dolichospermum sp. UHCC 0259]
MQVPHQKYNLIRNNATADASEQQIINWGGAGSCGGGWWSKAFDYLINNGTATEATVPYTATNNPYNDFLGLTEQYYF